MTEQKAIEIIKREEQWESNSSISKAFNMAINALEEIQQYRAIGTPEELRQLKENGAFTGIELAQLAAMQMKLKEYRTIGTVAECRKAVEKIQR